MDAAGDGDAAASGVSASQRLLMPGKSAAFSHKMDLSWCVQLSRTELVQAGSVVLQSKPDEWMNGEEGRGV